MNPVEKPGIEAAAFVAYPPLILDDGTVELGFNQGRRGAFIRGARWASSITDREVWAAARVFLKDELNGAEPNEEEISDMREALKAARDARRMRP